MLESINLDTILHILNGYDKGCQDEGVRPSKDWVRNHLDRVDERPASTGITGTRVSLDKNTLKWRAWTSAGVSSVPSEGLQDENAFVPTDTYENILGKKVYLYQPFYKLTANDFRKLNNQIRETSSAPTTRKNITTFKKHYNSRPSDNVTKLYRSQLASSLKAFDDRKWQSYENEANSVTSSRSRPTSSLSDSRHTQSRPGSSRVSALSKVRSRPRSSPAQRFITSPTPPAPQQTGQQSPRQSGQQSPQQSGQQTATTAQSLLQSTHELLQVRSLSAETKHSSFDCLTPEIVYELSAGPKPDSVYGDRSESALARLDELDEEDKGDDGSSGGASEDMKRGEVRGDRENIKEAAEPAYAGRSGTPAYADQRTDAGPDSAEPSDKETDLDSDEEDYPEPPIERKELCDLPNLKLRPEKMDAFDAPIYGRGDRRKYDFDARSVDYPACEFANPLPDGFESVSLRELSQSERNWREQVKVRPERPAEEYIVDRLVEFERLQARTVEWETARQERMRAVRQRQNKSKVYSQSRVQSARTWREKRCCLDCLQLACVGDCPGKPPANSGLCPVCSEKHCAGSCGQAVYDSRSRAEWDEEKPKPKPKYRPRSCAACQQRHNAKLINANSLALGRPKSSQATFTRGQNSARPKDARPRTGNGLCGDLQIEFESMALDSDLANNSNNKEADPVSRPGTAGSVPRRSGRAGVLPGKSFFSQRRVSLTEKEPSSERVKSLSNKRVKSSRRRRPNTAAL